MSGQPSAPQGPGGEQGWPYPARHQQQQQQQQQHLFATDQSTTSASSSHSGRLEEPDFPSTAESSSPSSPQLSAEKESEFRAWQRLQQQQGHFTPHPAERSKPWSRRPHVRKISEQIIQSVERMTAPIKATLFPSDEEEQFLKSPHTASDQPHNRLSAQLTPRRLKWLFRILLSLTGLLLISSLLPRSSHFSLWRALSDGPSEVYLPGYDAKNQKLAAGKGWGWKLNDALRGSAEPATPEDAALQQHQYAYGSIENQANETQQTFPDIQCRLDVEAFAHHYKLTSNFKYARRYVTAKPTPPDVNMPPGFDPQPRQLADSLVKDWNHLSWRGIGVTPEELCWSLKGKARQACVKKEKAKQNRTLQEQSLPQIDKRSPSMESRARVVAEKRVTQGSSRLALTELDSCASSLEPLEMPTYPVPRTRTQPHHLILGLATDVDRLLQLMPELSYSFSYSNLHLLLNLAPDSQRIPELRKALRSRGIRATLIQSTEEDYLRRWVELPSLLADFADPTLTRWAMVADDDTFWLSVPKLLKMLDKYDYTRSHYIGALTDDWRQSDSGMIAYGGGGVILSMPLLDEVRPHWSTCKESKDPGDHRLALCIYANTHTRLTIEWGLLQTDLHGDIRGLLESGKDITTMHHWRSWNTGFDPVLIARAGAVCGSECLLQRFVSNGTSEHNAFMFVHGLSLSLYPTPMPDFGKTEVTWKVWGNSQFSHSMGPTRQRLREGRPPLDGVSQSSGSRHHQTQWRETWTLEDVRLDSESGPATSWDLDGRGMREIYIKRANRPKGYLSTSLYNDQSSNHRISSTDDEDEMAEEELSAAEKHKQLESSVSGLVGKLFGLGTSQEDKLRQDELVKAELQEEEEDSVIELVWV
ncbi:unnamed protein product [Sympodiomycopsis kandeliae]